MPTPTTRTLNPLPFNVLEPKRFEDLVRQLAYDFRRWRMLEATGRTGSDEGYDARGFEITIDDADVDLEAGLMARRRLPPLGAGRDHIDLTPAASRCQPDAGQILPLAQSLLRSPECRLPLTGISRNLATTLDCALAALHEIPTLTDATLG